MTLGFVGCVGECMSFFVAILALGAGPNSDAEWLDASAQLLREFVKDELEVSRLLVHLEKTADATERALGELGPNDGVRRAVLRNVAANLRDKSALRKTGPPLPMTAEEIQRTVIDFEGFKLQRYVTSGVFPKRYFGYFDGKYDTAAYERRLRSAVSRATRIINDYQRKQQSPLRVSDIEIAVTFIAEGGAIFLRERQDLLEAMHPVMHVGLDDVAMGFSDLPGLQKLVDQGTDTDLGGLIGWLPKGAAAVAPPTKVPGNLRWLKHGNGKAGPHAYLKRYMTFEEAIVGTALMYIWEKEIAAKKVAAIKARPLHQRPLDEQFVLSSLVYNSGILHVPARWKMIREFSTGRWLFQTSERNATKRWRLNVAEPKGSLQQMRSGLNYPDQPTAWLAVYHVLQRYGAFVALRRYSDFFDAHGAFAPWP